MAKDVTDGGADFIENMISSGDGAMKNLPILSKIESREALAAYAVHPLHLEAKEKFHHFLDKRYCADYEY